MGMTRPRLHQSVVTRLVGCLVLGGILASAGTSFLEISRSEPLLQMEVTHQIVLVTRNLQTVVRGLVGRGSEDDIRHSLDVFTAGAPISGVRLVRGEGGDVSIGSFPNRPDRVAAHWALGEHSTASGREIDLRRPTFVQATFQLDGRPAAIELMVDGPGARASLRQREINRLLMHWLFLAITVLLGLLLVRRWVTGPLSDVVQHVRQSASADAFGRLAREYTGEFSQLSEAIGGMLTRIETTSAALRQRELAFEHLYQFAPAAMVSVDKAGRIVEANRRAAELLSAANERQLVDRAVLDFVRREDRPLLRQTIDRLDINAAARCELRLDAGGRGIDVVVECAGVRDDDGILRSVRLSLLDVSESKKLQRQLAEQTQLLNLVINHMSDAILLVDQTGRIAAFNQQLLHLLHARPDAIRGQSYDPATFWDDLGPLHPELLTNRLRQIDADQSRPAQERVETRVGTFIFQGIPVHDASEQCVGRLWVVQETTSQEQNQRLLTQQTNQLQALKRLGQELAMIDQVDDAQVRACELLYRIFDVEAVGMALRSPDGLRRTRQVLHRGGGPYLLAPNAELVQSIERHLMRQVLNQREVMFWPDLPRGMAWSPAFNAAGMTCLAAGPLRAAGERLGILWIARRGGERLERHHIYLLETLLPVIAARLEVAGLHERLRELELTDPVTNLPAVEPFRRAVARAEGRPGRCWSLIVIKLDHFRRLNDALSHDAADALLHDVAQNLTAGVRRNCFVARLEGVTFGILAPGHDLTEAVALADRLRQEIADHRVCVSDGSTLQLSASIGVAACPDDAGPGVNLLELAVSRALIARARGYGQIVCEGATLRQAG